MTFTTGTRVKYNHKYLKSIQADSSIAGMTGTVKKVVREIKTGLYYLKVLWDDESEEKGVLSSNIAKIKDGLLLDTTE